MSKEKIVIIPVHNQLLYLLKCVESVLLNSSNCKIIIIDDGSTDARTAEFIGNNGDNSWVVIRNGNAQGFSAACNKGIQYALDNFDFNCICLLNSDAEVVTEGWFEKVEKHFLDGDKIGVASVVSDNAMAQTIHNIPQYLKVIETKPTVYCSLVHGFAYWISKELIDAVGLFDEKMFPHYGSEDDYSLRSIKNGFHNIIVGSVFVKHHNETSYTHEVRAKFIKHTLPTLQRRWGYSYVANCVKQCNLAGKYLNNI